jgi:hypothetical protein
MTTIEELLNRIRDLEAKNSELQDKLDLIYSIVAPEDDAPDDQAPDDEDSPDDLVQINGVN